VSDEATTPAEIGTDQSIEERMGAFFAAPAADTGEEQADDPVEEEIVEAEAETVESDSVEVDESDEVTYTVRVAGEDETVSLPELLAGYSRTGDYKRKTQELAEMRRETQAEQQRLQAEIDRYATVLPQLQQFIEQAAGPEPDRNDYPNSSDYLVAKDAWNTRQAQLHAVQAEQQRLADEAQQAQLKQLQEYGAEQHRLLLERVPEWNDTSVLQREQSEMADYLRGEGYQDTELAQLFDHRFIVMARKARLYDVAQATGKSKAKAVKGKAKAASPGVTDTPTRGRDYRKQRERLKETGRTEDAASLLQGLFDKSA
jgi:hypothetical protein